MVTREMQPSLCRPARLIVLSKIPRPRHHERPLLVRLIVPCPARPRFKMRPRPWMHLLQEFEKLLRAHVAAHARASPVWIPVDQTRVPGRSQVLLSGRPGPRQAAIPMPSRLHRVRSELQKVCSVSMFGGICITVVVMDAGRTLLKRFADGDQAAFATLVREYLGLVHSAALRQTRDIQLAEDVAQMVFAKLARNPSKVPESAVLAGWLHADARFTALQFLRRERRRTHREEQHVQYTESTTETSWADLSPVLDEGMDQLPPGDRDAILLRYFQDLSFQQVGAALGLGEDAARMRVNRALEKLRGVLARRGLSTSGAALGALLSANAVSAAAPALVSSILLHSTTSMISGPVLTGALAQGFVMSNAKAILLGTAAILGLSVPMVWQHSINRRLHAENAQLQSEIAQLQSARLEDQESLNKLREEAAALASVQAELARLRGQSTLAAATTSSTLPPAPAASPAPEPPIAEPEIATFLGRSAVEQGRLLGDFRRGLLPSAINPEDYGKVHALAMKVRPKLEELESRPQDYADFQTEFIKEVVGLTDEQKIGEIRQILGDTFEQLRASGLNAAARPAQNVEEWATRRDALDRPATRAVEALLTPEERQKFSRAFLGVVGIDTGLGDGGWHRFSDGKGTTFFPSDAPAP